MSSYNKIGQKITSFNGNADFTGGTTSISKDGNVIAVGSQFHSSQAGLVRIYEWNDTSEEWDQMGGIL